MALSAIFLAAFFVPCSGQLSDHLDAVEVECVGEGRFQCLEGSCIPIEAYCDGKLDCPEGSDEDFCPQHLPDPEFCNRTHHFLCEDRLSCIPFSWLCNNETDCRDGSDEVNCTEIQEESSNATCIGFSCDAGKRCISELWVCDGKYDCKDKSDEIIEENCHHTLRSRILHDATYCQIGLNAHDQYYRCIDSSYCLPADMMCNGLDDCRDGSDEGPFCAHWHTMCKEKDNPCEPNITRCFPERYGPSCACVGYATEKQYNYQTKVCEDVDECAQIRPHCSHYCENVVGRYKCRCAEGYTPDPYGYLCYASGPEGLIFFTTSDKIAYVKIKSKQKVIVAHDIKQAHGVSYDGTYVYWVQTAQGHQAIMRAQLEDFEASKQVVVSLGLEDPGDIAVDWLGGHIYFSDAARGAISVCRVDGSICTTLHTKAKQPRFVTLDVSNGTMYWADWHQRPLIIQARMDGSQPEILVDNLGTFASGLALDAPNGRLYFVDKTIRVFKLDDKQSYSLFEEPFHHPYSIAVFENTIFWSDWTTNTIQTTDKVHGTSQKRFMLTSMETPVYDMHVYHPVLYKRAHNPCENASCSHLCLVVTNASCACACPAGMTLRGNICEHLEDYHPLYLVVGGGSSFIKLDYNSLGNPEVHTTHFDIGRVQAMAYDNTRDTLYLYDGQRRTINFINMTDFSLGVTHLFDFQGLVDIVDMDYDFASDVLYLVDAGRRFIEVVSLRTHQRALLTRFTDEEIPLSICVLPDYGKMLVAVMESEQSNIVYIDSIGLNGEDRQRLIKNDVQGPRIRLDYDSNMDVVYMADDGNGLIELMHPEGTGRETFRKITTTVASMALTDPYLFWTDRRTRLYWANVHEASHSVRRFEFTMFPENTQLHIQATLHPPDPRNPLLNHTCLTTHPCSHVCVQTPHAPLSIVHRSRKTVTEGLGYKCLCPPGLLIVNGVCTQLAVCKENELYCHKSNECFPKGKYCDGIQDCRHGEDEEDCNVNPAVTPGETDLCSAGQVVCNNVCIDKGENCTEPINNSNVTGPACGSLEYQVYCSDSTICIERAQICDGQLDCPSGSDENPKVCDTLACQPSEYMCTSGSCILKAFVCDGEPDCSDWSDEVNCTKKICGLGFYQCRSRECIEFKKRCDGHQDCIDLSDEEDCEDSGDTEIEEENLPRCTEQEYTCELNRSICIPLTARCNLKVDCPGGTDEINCDFHCAPHGKFECRQEVTCVEKSEVCNGVKNCLDGSDETPEACNMVNKTSALYPPTLYPAAECHDGYLCGNGQCIEWRYVCDKLADCFDGSDENGQCLTACNNHTCAFFCVSTPTGPHCMCPPGLKSDGVNCYDIDECKQEVCSHECLNIAGTFVCSCHYGYALRPDRRSCKATNGDISVLYSSGGSVWSISSDGMTSLRYMHAKDVAITDMGVDIRRNKLFVTIAEAGQLIEINHNASDVIVTNIGTPTKLAVDWLTGNVYFVDSAPSTACIRVCNVAKKQCSRLQKTPPNTEVTSLAVDPPSGRMFYCASRGASCVVWAAALDGHARADLATVANCAAMTVDSFKQLIYISEAGPGRILRMNFDGKNKETVFSNNVHFHDPRGLALFEDSIFYLTANSLKINRCSLFGKRLCEPFIYKDVPSSSFVLSHPSVQRNDVENGCEKGSCDGVCVWKGGVGRCVCGDQSSPVENKCRRLAKAELPSFNGWTSEDYTTAHHVTFTVITSVLVLFAVYLVIFVYYHLVHKPRRARPAPYMEVRFQNTSSGSAAPPSTSVVEITEAPASTAHEFVNPLEYVRDLWEQVRRQKRPVGTAGLEVNVPYEQQILSDTESDLDERETQQIIRN